MDWDTIQNVAGRIGIIAGALVGIGLIWVKGILPMLKFVAATVRAADALEEAVPVLKEIAEEFKPNAGSTLKDTVERMDRNIKRNSRNNMHIYKMIASLDGVDRALLEPFHELEEPPWNTDLD